MQTAEAAKTASVDEPGVRLEYRPLERCFAIGLVAILAGYALFGKGFAFLNVPVGFPLYVGEIVLGLGLAVMILQPRVFETALDSFPARMIIIFLGLGAARTIPYLGQYGIDAVRDAATCYYALFALLVCEIVRHRERLEKVAAGYGYAARYYVFWAPVPVILGSLAGQAIPLTPGTDMPFILIKSGDVVVHLVGAIAFSVFVGQHLRRPGKSGRSLLWYGAAVASGLFLVARARAAFLALSSGLLVAAALARPGRLWKPVLAALMVLTVLLIVNPRIPLGRERAIWLDLMSGEVGSIFVPTSDPRLREGTKQWRLAWWTVILEETCSGPYFWTGRGFGVNLADAHGFQVLRVDTRPLRSPHNSHMTVLARMGVPGFILWVLLQGSLVWHFYSSWCRAREAGDRFLQGVMAWILCYWAAFIVNSSFDVYFEGPMGAIWFWSVMGLGLAASRMKPQPTGAERLPA